MAQNWMEIKNPSSSSLGDQLVQKLFGLRDAKSVKIYIWCMLYAICYMLYALLIEELIFYAIWYMLYALLNKELIFSPKTLTCSIDRQSKHRYIYAVCCMQYAICYNAICYIYASCYMLCGICYMLYICQMLYAICYMLYIC